MSKYYDLKNHLKEYFSYNTGRPKKVRTSEYLGKYKFYKKIFRIKVAEFKNLFIDLIKYLSYLILGGQDQIKVTSIF